MRNYGFLLVVLVLAPVCVADVGEFFDKLFGVFKPEGIVVTDAPDNATASVSNSTAALDLVTEAVPTEFVNDTKVISGKLTSIVEESLTTESEDGTSEATTDQDTTISSTTSTTTTVVYKLFHPNTTTTADPTMTTATAVTTSTTESAKNTKDHLTESTVNATVTSTTASSSQSTSLPTAATVTTFNTENTSLSKSSEETTAASTIPSAPGTLALSLASTAIVNDVICKTTYDPIANLKVTSCADSTTPKAHQKRSAEYNGEHFSVADTIQNVNFPEDSYPSSSEVGDDDGDAYGSNANDEYQPVPINTYG